MANVSHQPAKTRRCSRGVPEHPDGQRRRKSAARLRLDRYLPVPNSLDGTAPQLLQLGTEQVLPVPLQISRQGIPYQFRLLDLKKQRRGNIGFFDDACRIGNEIAIRSEVELLAIALAGDRKFFVLSFQFCLGNGELLKTLSEFVVVFAETSKSHLERRKAFTKEAQRALDSIVCSLVGSQIGEYLTQDFLKGRCNVKNAVAIGNRFPPDAVCLFQVLLRVGLQESLKGDAIFVFKITRLRHISGLDNAPPQPRRHPCPCRIDNRSSRQVSEGCPSAKEYLRMCS